MAQPIYLEGAEQFVAAKAAHRVVLRADGLRDGNYWHPAGSGNRGAVAGTTAASKAGAGASSRRLGFHRDNRPGLGRVAPPASSAPVPPIGLPSEDLAVANATLDVLERATGGLETKLRHLKDDLNFAVSVYNAQALAVSAELARVAGRAAAGGGGDD